MLDAVPIVSGVYVGSDEPMTRDYSHATRLSVAPAQHITDLVLRPQLGTNLAGTVTGDGAPLAEVCVSALDPASGAVDGRYTQDDGRWSMIVPPGSYLVQAIDCSPGRNYAGRFSVDATARRVRRRSPPTGRRSTPTSTSTSSRVRRPRSPVGSSPATASSRGVRGRGDARTANRRRSSRPGPTAASCSGR